MAEFKTAEQYVVEKVEYLERELDNAKIEHSMELAKFDKALADAQEKLRDAYDLLNMLRDFIDIRKDDYWKQVVGFENIYGKENPELVERLMEYYDMYPEEDDNDE